MIAWGHKGILAACVTAKQERLRATEPVPHKGIVFSGNNKAVRKQVNADVWILPEKVQISIGYRESRERETVPENAAGREVHLADLLRQRVVNE